jgi:hypothetical protein
LELSDLIAVEKQRATGRNSKGWKFFDPAA